MRFICPNCGQPYELTLDDGGRKAVCEKCGAAFVIPTAGGVALPPVPANCERCPDCGGVVSRRARHCPHCGRPFDRITLRGVCEIVWILFLVPIAFVVMLVFFGAGGGLVLAAAIAIWLQTITWAFFR